MNLLKTLHRLRWNLSFILVKLEEFNFEHLFTLDDQKRFAKLSGDYNPIHISEKISRKLITGECIVHGINLFLVGLENLTLLNN